MQQTTDKVHKDHPARVSHLRVGTSGDPATTQAAQADTSGATLGELETEVNNLKALLRTFGLLTP